MKKLLLFLAIPLMAFQCEPEETESAEPITYEQNCQCFEEIVYLNDGTEVYLVDLIEADQNKCDNWGQGENYLKLNDSDFYHRFIKICD